MPCYILGNKPSVIFSMLKAFLKFLDPLENGSSDRKRIEELTVPLATAVLFYELIRADGELDENEMATYEELLLKEFDVEASQLEPVLKKVEQKAKHAVDLVQFTRLIHEQCSLEEKKAIVQSLWHLAAADGKVDSHEEHLIRKIADLMYLDHADYIKAKLAVMGNF